MRLTSGTAMTYPVDLLMASAPDLVGVQTSLVIHLFVPVLLHWMLAVCQKRVLLSGLTSVADIEAFRASSFAMRAFANSRIPLMPILTLPCYNLTTAGCVVMCCALVFVTELSSYSRMFGSKRVVLTNVSVGTVRTGSAI